MRKHCGNCANHKKETYQLSDECGKCVAATLENGERTDPSHWREKPKTNADRIRSMTDEELARFLDDVHWSAFEAKGLLSRLKHPVDANDWCEWLEQPAKGE